MTTKKTYNPWIKWHGGECPVPPDTLVEPKLRNGVVMQPGLADSYEWGHIYGHSDIVEYRTFTKQTDLEADLEAAENLLRDNGYTVIPPSKPLTFEDVEPLTEMPPDGTQYWVVEVGAHEGVYHVLFRDKEVDSWIIKRRMAYLDKEHALIAARHIFGLKGGEL